MVSIMNFIIVIFENATKLALNGGKNGPGKEYFPSGLLF